MEAKFFLLWHIYDIVASCGLVWPYLALYEKNRSDLQLWNANFTIKIVKKCTTKLQISHNTFQSIHKWCKLNLTYYDTPLDLCVMHSQRNTILHIEMQIVERTQNQSK